MKAGIHPKLYKNAKVTDLSGGVFYLASTKEEIVVEVSNETHPYYTGKQRIVDTENLVSKYKKREEQKNSSALEQRKAKRIARNQKASKISASPKLTLKDLMQRMK